MAGFLLNFLVASGKLIIPHLSLFDLLYADHHATPYRIGNREQSHHR